MKTCLVDDCFEFVFSHSYCYRHQHHRRDEKWIKKMANKPKRSPVNDDLFEDNERYHSKTIMPHMRKITPKKAKERKENHEEDLKFYLEIWDERPHYCEITGKYLGEEPLTTFFHHILQKSKYPKLRYVKRNIILLSPDVSLYIS